MAAPIRGIYRIGYTATWGLRLTCGMRTVAESLDTRDGVHELRRAAERDAGCELDWKGGESWSSPSLQPFRGGRVMWQANDACQTILA